MAAVAVPPGTVHTRVHCIYQLVLYTAARTVHITVYCTLQGVLYTSLCIVHTRVHGTYQRACGGTFPSNHQSGKCMGTI